MESPPIVRITIAKDALPHGDRRKIRLHLPKPRAIGLAHRLPRSRGYALDEIEEVCYELMIPARSFARHAIREGLTDDLTLQDCAHGRGIFRRSWKLPQHRND